jgi:hypothetical protein
MTLLPIAAEAATARFPGDWQAKYKKSLTLK